MNYSASGFPPQQVAIRSSFRPQVEEFRRDLTACGSRAFSRVLACLFRKIWNNSPAETSL